jgi:hypothetical protein
MHRDIRDRQGMWPAWERREMCIEFRRKYMKGEENLEYLSVTGIKI